ncbi:hypothetical protein LguiA_014303 [Lonicera macranthoides]
MATRKQFFSKLIHSCRLMHTVSSSHPFFTQSECLTNKFFNRPPNIMKQSLYTPSWSFSTMHLLAIYNFSYSRSYSTRNSKYGDTNLDGGFKAPHYEFADRGFDKIDDYTHSEVAEAMVTATGGGEESILPVRAIISLLDGYHDLTSLPWWIIIASSTLALRLALFPLLIIQLQKLATIGELFPKLPPPLPPPLSGRSYIDQITVFRKERRAIGCPSYLWFLAYISVQFPCFLLWMTSIRRMSLDHHPGFDCGGILWFQNLTELPHGVLGPIIPLLIGGLHFVNVQVSFRRSSVGEVTDLFGLLAKYYKYYLDFMTLPLIFTAFCIPQGSLVYWLTNSSLTLVQNLSLNNPLIRNKLGLPDKQGPVKAAKSQEISVPEPLFEPSTEQKKVNVQNLCPQELVALSVLALSRGQKDRAIPLLRLALEKDPKYVRALTIMGQTLLQNGVPTEAIEYLERAISTLFLVGQPTEVEDVDLLILASQWAGVAYLRQGKTAEGMVHLERIASLKEPEDSKSKAHYYDGLVLFASSLYNQGHKAEAAKYLQMAAAYSPEYKSYLEDCENGDDNFVSDLAESRRRDY